MTRLFSPIKLHGFEMKNRLVRSATWEALAKADGSIGQDTISLYTELARGGVGLIVSGFTSVDSDDQYFDGMMRLSDDSLIPQYRVLTEAVHAQQVPIIAQLALGGFYDMGELIEPDKLTQADISKVKEMFVAAAMRANEAGFDGVQIHGAHFFFLSRMMSGATNHRTDEYGGTIENRMRLVLEIVDEIKRQLPEFHLSIKINASDFTAGGIEFKEMLIVGRLLEQHGIDSIEVSGNGTSVAGVKPYKNEGYFVPYAIGLAKEVAVPVMVVGGLRSADLMEAVLTQSNIQLLSLSRPLIAEPDLPKKLAENELAQAKCISCNGCYRSAGHRCVVFKN